MSRSLQREWLADILESAPSLAFVALLRSGTSLETAGWIGAALAAMVLAGFQAQKIRFNPILLGINIHLLLVTPLIVSAYWLGASELGAVLAHHSYRAVLLTIVLVGAALTVFSARGFIAVEGLSRSATRRQSVILLLAALIAVAWSFTRDGSGVLVGVALPIIALFALRRFLIARCLDRGGEVNGIAAAGGSAMFARGYETDAGQVN